VGVRRRWLLFDNLHATSHTNIAPQPFQSTQSPSVHGKFIFVPELIAPFDIAFYLLL
jgi:hypothetical protein